VDIVTFRFLVGLYRELYKIGWTELDAIWHSGCVGPTMYTVTESAVCTSPQKIAILRVDIR